MLNYIIVNSHDKNQFYNMFQKTRRTVCGIEGNQYFIAMK